jgi:hypothetical protein
LLLIVSLLSLAVGVMVLFIVTFLAVKGPWGRRFEARR